MLEYYTNPEKRVIYYWWLSSTCLYRKRKSINKVLSYGFKLTDTIFPNQSPAAMDDDAQFWNNEQSNTIHHRYCLFESILKVQNVTDKLLQLERL